MNRHLPDDQLVEIEIAAMNGIGKTRPWPWGLSCTKAGDVSAFHARNVDFDLIDTHFSHSFRWNS